MNTAAPNAGLLTPEYRRIHKIPPFSIFLTNFTPDPAWDAFAESNDAMWWKASKLEAGTSLPTFLAGSCSRHSEKEYRQFQQLHQVLLAVGGTETCFPAFEEDMEKILERGYYRSKSSRLLQGTPSRCHANVAELWENNHRDKDVTICTGYALSSDGMWRQHSWLLHRYIGGSTRQHREQVVETTVKRLAYYGFELTDAEAQEFADNNY